MWRRVCRLYPTFLAVFVMYLAAAAIVPSRSKLPHDPLGCLVYLVQICFCFQGLSGVEPFVTVSWSLSYEVFFYTTLPLVVGRYVAKVERADAQYFVCRSDCGSFRFGAVRCARSSTSGYVSGGILLFELVQSLHM